jgi:coronamic acid synthetase CmaA, adenylation and thiolation didomain protein
VVARAGADSLGDSRLTAFCGQALQSYMVPDEIHFLAELPVTENGKVDRRSLAFRFAEGG